MLPIWWSDRFGDVLPLGYCLRQALRDRWIRVHSLPDGKRYPDSDTEWRELLDRHAAVADAVLEHDAACRVVRPVHAPGELGDVRTFEEFGTHGFGCVASDRETSFWAAAMNWNAESVQTALEAIADDRCRALWMNDRSGEVYAPYDGGADLIVSSRERRDELVQRFSAWLSPRPDGL